MRLCFVTTEYPTKPPFGGIATYVRATARWLVDHGHRVHVLLPDRSGPWGTEYDGDIPVDVVPPQRIKPRRLLSYASHLPGLGMLHEAYCGWNRVEDSLGAWLALRRLASRNAYDIIEVGDYAGLGWWGLTWPRRRTPIVVRGHFLTDPKSQRSVWPGSQFQYQMERQCARRADLVLTNSAALASRYRQECQVPTGRLHALPLGFELPDRQLAPVEQIQDWAQETLVLFVGWLDPRKGVDLLLDAMRIVHARHPHVRLVLAGSITDRFGSELDKLLQGTEGWARHIGSVPEETVYALMQMSTLVAMPSRNEPFGRVAVEAQLCGCPVVASRVGGLTEVVQDGRTGLLTPPEDVDALASAILKLVTTPELAAEMGRQARAIAEANYEMSHVMQRQVAWYQRLAQAQGAGE